MSERYQTYIEYDASNQAHADAIAEKIHSLAHVVYGPNVHRRRAVKVVWRPVP